MIFDLLSPEVRLFLKEIESLGFELCLVGGFTRDYFYNKKLGYDLDFEIRPNTKIALKAWPLYYKKLHQYFIDHHLVYSELPYLITRVHFENTDFEFSSPRLEIDIPEDFSHHHFRAELDPNLSFALSFKRRDFTINAIGILLDGQIVDPYNGIEDLKNGVLRNITDDFFLDSVRFLRLIRFKLKFNTFLFSENLYSRLNLFNLSKLSVYHFTQELFKSHPAEFLNLFSQLVMKKKWVIPEAFKVWTKYIFPAELKTKDELLAYVFLHNKDDALLVSDFFLMPEKKLKDLKSFKKSEEALLKMEIKDFLEILSCPLEIALKHEIFKDLKNLLEKKEWNFILNLENKNHKRIIDPRNLQIGLMTTEELAVISPALRSFYPFYKMLKKIFSND